LSFKPEGVELEQRAVEESLALAAKEDIAQARLQNHEIHGLRIGHAKLLFCLTVAWVAVIWLVVLFQGFGQWFIPIPDCLEYIKFKLSDAVMIAFMTTTTTTVLGLYGIAAYWLYGKPKAEGKSVATKADPKKVASPKPAE